MPLDDGPCTGRPTYPGKCEPVNESLGTSPSIPLSEIRLDTVTAVTAPPETGSAAPLLHGRVYVAQGDPDRRWFVVAASYGTQLVDVRGLHWPVDIVARQWGPLQLVQS